MNPSQSKKRTKAPCSHRGSLVRAGPYMIMAGGMFYLRPEDLSQADVVIPLENKVPAVMGQRVQVLACPWPDFQPPPEGFEQFLRKEVIPELERGRKLLVYCAGGHGRTGTFLASLIAILEPEAKDPIARVRKRYCRKAVETAEQAEFVIALKGEKLLSQEPSKS